MKDLVLQVQAISRRFQNEIDVLTGPLESLFGVNAYLYYRIDSQGGLITLCDRPEISEYYFDQQLYKSSPFLKHPKLIPSGFLLASEVEHQNFQSVQSHMNAKFELYNHLLIVENEGDVVHLHGFATTHRKRSLVNTYFNNLDRIRSYCQYFQARTSRFQNILDGMKVDFGGFVGPQFYKTEITSTPQLSAKHQADFFHYMNKLCGGLKLYKPLSDREMECLQLLLAGKSASLIAEELAISTRTAEHHIDHIKNKLMCMTKTDIFSFVATIKKLGGNLSLLQQPWES